MNVVNKCKLFIKDEYARTKNIYLDIAVVLAFFAVVLIAFIKKGFGIFGIEGYALNSLFYPVLSVFANVLIAKLVQTVLAVKNIKLHKEHLIYIAGVFGVFFVFYFIFLRQRNFIYYWDFSGYLVKQYWAEEAFSNGLKEGLARIVDSFSWEYTEFINVFTEFPFCLTRKTGDSYVLCQLFNVFLPVLFLLSGTIIRLGELLKVEKKRIFFGLSFISAVIFPILHNAASFGQPDWFGMIFCLSIVLLTLDYKFEKLDFTLCFVLFVSTALLVLTRRWYLYFIVGYYFAYTAFVLIDSLNLIRKNNKEQGKAQIKSIFIFGIFSVAIILVVFRSIITNILSYDYADRYAFYQLGGFFLECANQLIVVGIFGVIMLIGIIYSVCRKSAIPYVFIAISGWLISVFSFTRVQTLGFHHHLLILSYYYILLFAGIASVLKITKKKLYRSGIVFCIISIVLQPFIGASRFSIFFNEKIGLSDFINDDAYSIIEATFGSQADSDKVKEVTDWIDDNCKNGEKAFLIPHNFRYNSDIFKNINLPNRNIYDKLSFGFDVLGTHKFPVELFDSKYVLTAEPFPNKGNSKGLSGKLNKAFFDISKDKYRCVKAFDMGDGYVFYVYERIIPSDREEVLKYLDAFSQEDEKFPDLFSDVINEYLNKMPDSDCLLLQ